MFCFILMQYILIEWRDKTDCSPFRGSLFLVLLLLLLLCVALYNVMYASFAIHFQSNKKSNISPLMFRFGLLLFLFFLSKRCAKLIFSQKLALLPGSRKSLKQFRWKLSTKLLLVNSSVAIECEAFCRFLCRMFLHFSLEKCRHINHTTYKLMCLAFDAGTLNSKIRTPRRTICYYVYTTRSQYRNRTGVVWAMCVCVRSERSVCSECMLHIPPLNYL